LSTPSYRLKLDRAVEHLYALQAASERWAQTDPCLVWEECEIESRKHLVYAEVTIPPDDPLIPLRLADCIHNMRAALDHLAYALACQLYQSDPPPNEGNTAFPITTTTAHFKNSVHGKIAPKRLMPRTLYAALEAVQPHPGRDQALWVLHELDNFDKHRFLPLVVGVAAGHGFHVGSFSGSHFAGPRLGILKPQTPVVEYIPAPDTEVDMHLHFSGAITLAESSPAAGGQFVLPVVSGLRLFILNEVLPRIEPFL
jgi:hypothetical protein